MKRVALVVDLGFGDAGKGVVTDALVRALGAMLVVRFNGGAQAGHNVVTPDGRHHTFAQLGAGSFVPGVRTFLARQTVLHPTALGVEAAHLEAAGVPDPLSRVVASERALVITPFHQAANRLRELARGRGRHGSCGVGVGETVADALSAPDDAARMGDFARPMQLWRKLRRVQDEKRDALSALRDVVHGMPGAAEELSVLDGADVIDRWLTAAQAVVRRVAVVEDGWLGDELARDGAVVFEGAQGVLLDEWAGFHPYTTWSTCSFAGALELLREHGHAGEVIRWGVLRTYLVRHGQGPMPTEDDALEVLPEPHNQDGPWQGSVRRGWPDAVLARYAAGVCGGVDRLALTHLDALARVGAWKVCRGYRVPEGAEALFDAARAGETIATGIRLPAARDLARQERLAVALGKVAPVYEAAAWSGEGGAARAGAFFEEAVGARVGMTAWGPSARGVRLEG